MLDFLSASKCRVFIQALTILTVLVLVGCGQKGNLYLPNIPPAPDVLMDDIHSGPVISNEGLSEVPEKLTDKTADNESEQGNGSVK